MEILEELKRFVDAQCAIALELKNLNTQVSKLAKNGVTAEVEVPDKVLEAPADLTTRLPDPGEVAEEKDRIKARLVELGVPVPARARIGTMREMLVEAEKNIASGSKIGIIYDPFKPEAPKAAAVEEAEIMGTADPKAHTLDDVRAALTSAHAVFLAQEKGEDVEANKKIAWAKIRNLVVKHAGVSKASEIPAERYGVLLMGLKAATAVG